MSKKELPAEDAGIDTAELGINTAIESIAGVPIPKPVRQNALKAFGRLCSAAIEMDLTRFSGQLISFRERSPKWEEKDHIQQPFVSKWSLWSDPVAVPTI